MQLNVRGRRGYSGRSPKTTMGAMLIVALASVGAMTEQAAASPYLTRYASGAAPAGFTGICSRYAWACSNSGQGTVRADKAMLAMARTINKRVNRAIAPRSDQQVYGRSEYWTLPERGVGDCEDYALAKQKALIEQGVPPNRLYLATVVGSPQDPHTVLVMRTGSGDYVLDNLTSRVKSWQATPYTFLKMQNSRDRRLWDTILLGPRARRG